MAQSNNKKGEVRRPVVAGAFYPGDPVVLKQQIKDFLDSEPEVEMKGKIIAIISPHAGYMYSGQVAAFGYTLLEGSDFKKVIVIAPSHRARFHGASVYNKTGYETPLGTVPVDGTLCANIMAQHKLIDHYPQAHSQEHSLEVQVPFLQTVLNSFQLVPIVMGSQDFESCRILSNAIVNVIKDDDVLIVASSDLSHFYHYDKAVRLDRVVLDHIEKFDAKGLARDLAEGRCEACGGGPMITAMLIAKKLGANNSKVLKYANSGDVTGDKSGVVGYASAVIYKNQKDAGDKAKNERVGVDLGLNKEEKKTLLHIAKTTIECKAKKQEVPEFHITSDVLREKRGAFVTLHKRGGLRGCIGNIRGNNPLYMTIRQMASAAAFDDPRFPPVTKEELADLDIEISVLTPLRIVEDVGEVEVGKHGIYIEKGYQSGLLLPQVATEQRWDRMTFLEQTCYKAGLPKNAWREKDTRVYIFSADIFSEDKL
ncbi:MAG: AmmeMemoRadiSam system protein B [Thermodesulfobacteriota bacterium]|nr:AmmeMemoRadiSam system protein B [Thermodesulfobacteriota bacterium]